ncbi:hypothetical protein PHMEG_00016029 [Phytophthora megakarya]|uniref:Uncharacterized protein n=1 Tax=Phytophthora megakarya TaxID=4795 RepID=A0A225VZZ7_9STRA|nr:hypothetical protein PHMEG_00016029 [Phytophthora megakarya]
MCEAVDGPFNALTENIPKLSATIRFLKHRTRAAELYKNVVSWSLWYAHSDSIPEGGWIVEVDKCVCGCKFFTKFFLVLPHNCGT